MEGRALIERRGQRALRVLRDLKLGILLGRAELKIISDSL